jgi:hypothetical protein
MRFTEFKRPLTFLYEAARDPSLYAINAIHSANLLTNITDQLPEEQFSSLVKFNANLDKISAHLESVIGNISASISSTEEPEGEESVDDIDHVEPQQATIPAEEEPAPVEQPVAAEEPVKEAVGYQRNREYNFPSELQHAKETLEIIKDQIARLNALAPKTTKEKTERETNLKFANEMLERQTRTWKGFQAAVDERNLFKQQKEEADKFLNDIAKYLTILGDRVQGYTSGIESIDMKGMKSADKKKILNAQQFTQTLRQALFGLIIEIANKRTEASIDPLRIKGFLEACVKGEVIDMNKVVASDSGNIKNALNGEWADVFQLFVEQNIFNYSPGTTSGAVGPGEMALSMMANPTEKAPVGDLMVNNVMYEVKAGKKNGGRLNSKGIGKATTGWKVWSEIIEKIVQGDPKDKSYPGAPAGTKFYSNTDPKGNILEKGVSAKQFSANMTNANKNKNTGRTTLKAACKYNWNKKGFDLLNNEVLAHSTRPATVALFVESMKSIFNNYEAVAKKMEQLGVGSPSGLIGQAISRDGKRVEMHKMNKAITAMAFVSYHLEDHIENILFLNTESLDYTIFRGEGGDPTDLLDKIDSGMVKITSGFNWNDAQQTPTPSYNAGAGIE